MQPYHTVNPLKVGAISTISTVERRFESADPIAVALMLSLEFGAVNIPLKRLNIWLYRMNTSCGNLPVGPFKASCVVLGSAMESAFNRLIIWV
jgi:hypothetical protein